MSSSTSPQLTKRSSTGAATKRQSAAVAAPKPPLASSSRAVIAAHASLTGLNRITLGPHAILNPYARISSTVGPVSVGDGCVLWEKAAVGIAESSVKSGDERAQQEKQWGTTLGKHVVVESMAVVEAREVGEGTLIESGAKVGMGSILGKYCTIAPGTEIPPFTTLPDYTVAFGASQRRTDTTLQDRENIMKLKVQAHEKLLESLILLIPNNLSKWL